MAFTCGFFDSVNGDRRYNSRQLSQIFDGIIVDGVFAHYGTHFAITPVSGMEINVGEGRFWFNHVWGLNDGNTVVTIDPADVSGTRKDAIIIEIDSSDDVRNAFIKVLKGTYSGANPTLTNSGNLHQYPLAYVTVPAASTEITASNIEVVVGTSECPFATGVLENVSIDNLFNQWDAQFQEWFSGIQSQLEGDVVTNLVNEINQLKENSVSKDDLNDLSNNVKNDRKTILNPYDNNLYEEVTFLGEPSTIYELLYDQIVKDSTIYAFFCGKTTKNFTCLILNNGNYTLYILNRTHGISNPLASQTISNNLSNLYVNSIPPYNPNSSSDNMGYITSWHFPKYYMDGTFAIFDVGNKKVFVIDIDNAQIHAYQFIDLGTFANTSLRYNWITYCGVKNGYYCFMKNNPQSSSSSEVKINYCCAHPTSTSINGYTAQQVLSDVIIGPNTLIFKREDPDYRIYEYIPETNSVASKILTYSGSITIQSTKIIYYDGVITILVGHYSTSAEIVIYKNTTKTAIRQYYSVNTGITESNNFLYAGSNANYIFVFASGATSSGSYIIVIDKNNGTVVKTVSSNISFYSGNNGNTIGIWPLMYGELLCDDYIPLHCFSTVWRSSNIYLYKISEEKIINVQVMAIAYAYDEYQMKNIGTDNTKENTWIWPYGSFNRDVCCLLHAYYSDYNNSDRISKINGLNGKTVYSGPIILSQYVLRTPLRNSYGIATNGIYLKKDSNS